MNRLLLIASHVLAVTAAPGFSPAPQGGTSPCTQRLCVNWATQYPCDSLDDECVLGGALCDNCQLAYGTVWCPTTGRTMHVLRCVEFPCWCPP